MHRPLALIPALLLGLLLGGDALGQGKPPPLGAAPGPQPGGFPPLPTSKPPPLAPGPQAGVPGKPGGPAPGGTGRMISSGTGFVVAPGRALTNAHVVERCRAVRVRLANGTDATARVLRADRQRDLALIEIPADSGPALSFRREMNMRRGEGVVTYGFPLAGMLSSGPTLTTGEISALAGLADDQRQFQISAPVQPGNSGGPLLDLGGQVVGVIVSKLNAARVAQRTGDIPQNVNFAVKGNEAVDFLRAAGVTPTLADNPPRSPAEVGEIAHPSTLFMRCMG
ncbi:MULTISPECIES: S1C family serine protease [Roseomonadaceae]|uniref:Trypsin-like peptidase domain-containing protein n=1 Tax=Falsiroseomonas oleicola TaxID=2801474 RepID=A0ABS6H2V0_9PROT|nr:serine protease [Roseomonas oleicola]MBU8542994.1 trypsin-like peptidase domain-containing protein [Roseomonas oleicola]